MSFLLGLRRLGLALVTRGLGYSDGAPPPVTTTQGCIDARVLTPASILSRVRPAAIIETDVDAATIIETRTIVTASILSRVRPAAVIGSRVVAC